METKHQHQEMCFAEGGSLCFPGRCHQHVKADSGGRQQRALTEYYGEFNVGRVMLMARGGDCFLTYCYNDPHLP